MTATIAPYKRAIKVDETGLTITILFPLLDIPIDMFHLLHDQPVIINNQEFYRIHGYDMNQPVRLIYNDDWSIIVVLVLFSPFAKIDITEKLKVNIPYKINPLNF